MPAPMPLEPPVTRAILPLNDFACICHQNPFNHLLCPFWIVLSRMEVRRNSFPRCPKPSLAIRVMGAIGRTVTMASYLPAHRRGGAIQESALRPKKCRAISRSDETEATPREM